MKTEKQLNDSKQQMIFFTNLYKISNNVNNLIILTDLLINYLYRIVALIVMYVWGFKTISDIFL